MGYHEPSARYIIITAGLLDRVQTYSVYLAVQPRNRNSANDILLYFTPERYEFDFEAVVDDTGIRPPDPPVVGFDGGRPPRDADVA